jgi:hypothetical protein
VRLCADGPDKKPPGPSAQEAAVGTLNHSRSDTLQNHAISVSVHVLFPVEEQKEEKSTLKASRNGVLNVNLMKNRENLRDVLVYIHPL